MLSLAACQTQQDAKVYGRYVPECKETLYLGRGDREVRFESLDAAHPATFYFNSATHNYTFIWGMGGENLDYGDQDFSKITDLK